MKRNLKWVWGVAKQYGVSLVVGQLFRMIYGNDAGFVNNLKGRYTLKQIHKKLKRKYFVADLRADSLNNEGYLRVNSKYDSQLLDSITKKYEALMQDEKHSMYIGPRIREAIRALIDPMKDIPELRFLLTDEVRQIVESYYHAHVKVLHVRSWRNYHVAADYTRQDVYSNLWHNDPFPTTLLRYFVYLTDHVNEETGALRLHPIQDTKKLMRLGYLRRRAIIGRAARMIEDPKKVIVVDGNCGSGCLMNPQLCLHRAGVPLPGKFRDIVQFTLAPAHEPLSKTWYEELAPDPNGIQTRY